MCNLYLDFSEVADEYETTVERVKEIVEFSDSKLQEFIDDNLLEVDGDIIKIQPEGSFIVRNIAMCFDPKLKNDTAQYSRTV